MEIAITNENANGYFYPCQSRILDNGRNITVFLLGREDVNLTRTQRLPHGLLTMVRLHRI